jgi:uncharacterized protein YjdB
MCPLIGSTTLRRWGRWLAFVPLFLSLSGCGEFWVDPTLNSIVVTDNKGITTPTADVGNTVQMRALGKFNDGSQDTITATWSSSNPTIATIDSSTGLLTATATGTTTVTATNTGVTGTASVTVCGTEQLITISPDNPSLSLASGATQFTATAGGINFTENVTWSSSNPAVATISNTPGTQGLATFVGTGTTMIKAGSCSQTDSTLLSVF